MLTRCVLAFPFDYDFGLRVGHLESTVDVAFKVYQRMAVSRLV